MSNSQNFLEAIQNEIKLNNEFISFLKNYCEMGEFIRINLNDLVEEQEKLKQILLSVRFLTQNLA